MPTQTKGKKTQRTSTSTSDPVLEYCNEVLAGRILAGKLVRLACERHLKDLNTGAARGLKWDLAAALRAIQFFPDVLRLAEGDHAGKPFVLNLWQKFVIGSLYGWKGEDGKRRFRIAYIEVGKGNGKSPMAGGVGLYMLTADGEASAECYAAATTREQASILFSDAVKMVDQSPALSARIIQSGKQKVFNLAHMASGSFFRPVSSEGKGLDGKRVHYAALDEIHEHPNATVVDKMRAGTKGRSQALIFEITNSGFDRKSVCRHHHDYSRQVLEGSLQNDAWFAYVCGLDKDDDWRNEKVWVKPNPNLGVSIGHKYLREQVLEAVGIPSKENIVKRLNFCIWTEQSERWMPVEVWNGCGGLGAIDENALMKRKVFGALDLASKVDIASLAMVFPPEDPNGIYQALFRHWVPKDNVRRRAERDGVPYADWIDQGLITATEGNITDYDVIRRDINALGDRFAFQEIAFDPWNATQLATQLSGDGFTMVEFRQGFQSMTEPTKQLMALCLAKKINHGDNAVLRWMASNVAVKQDPAGNLKPDKGKSTEKIDGIVALIMALGRAIVQPDLESVYDSRGLRTI
jgi:phage terminase large subunit-like protein